jgi:hypothetical protein
MMHDLPQRSTSQGSFPHSSAPSLSQPGSHPMPGLPLFHGMAHHAPYQSFSLPSGSYGLGAHQYSGRVWDQGPH